MRSVCLLALLATPALADPVTVTDGNGREVTLAEPPERIVCLLINCAEELAFLGVTPVAIGAGSRETMVSSGIYGERIETIGSVPDGDGVDLEAVAAFDPDLVIGFLEDAPQLEQIAPTYTLNFDVARLEDRDLFLRDVRTLATLLGIEAEAEARIDAVLDRHAAYVALAPADRVSFATIYVVEEGRSFWVSPDCNLFVRDLVDCTHPGGTDWIQSGPELLLSMDPEVLVVDDYDQGEAEFMARATAEDPVWSALSAVEAGRLHLVDGNLSRMRTIATVGPGLDALMPLLYPETFPAPLTEAEVAAAVGG
jgi:iron complex transport system substrate-binding protein